MSANGGLTPGDPLGAGRSEDAAARTPETDPDATEARAPTALGQGARAAGSLGGDAAAVPRNPAGRPDADESNRAGLDFSGRPVRARAPAPSTAPGYTSPPPPGALRPPAGAFGVPSGAGTGVGAAGTYVLAGWWRRVGATVIDGLIISVGAILILLLFGSIFSVGFFASEETGAISLIIGLLLATVAVTLVALAYAPLLMIRTNGKTIGRMATGIRVVRASGEPMTLKVAVLREVVIKALVFGVAGSFTFGLASLIDYLWPLWDEENRALHDFPVDTRTIMG